MPEQRYDKCLESFFKPVDDLQCGDVVTYMDKSNRQWKLEVTSAKSPTKTFWVLNGPEGHVDEFREMHCVVAAMLQRSYVHRNGIQIHPEAQS